MLGGGGAREAGFQGTFLHLPVHALMYLSSEDPREDSLHARWVPTHSSYYHISGINFLCNGKKSSPRYSSHKPKAQAMSLRIDVKF